jgi:hypothetical protein
MAISRGNNICTTDIVISHIGKKKHNLSLHVHVGEQTPLERNGERVGSLLTILNTGGGEGDGEGKGHASCLFLYMNHQMINWYSVRNKIQKIIS